MEEAWALLETLPPVREVRGNTLASFFSLAHLQLLWLHIGQTNQNLIGKGIWKLWLAGACNIKPKRGQTGSGCGSKQENGPHITCGEITHI